MNYAEALDYSGNEYSGRISKCFHCGGSVEEIEVAGANVYDPRHSFAVIPFLADKPPALLTKGPWKPLPLSHRWWEITGTHDWREQHRIYDAVYDRAQYCGFGG